MKTFWIIALISNVALLANNVFNDAAWWRIFIDVVFIVMSIAWVEIHHKRGDQ